MCREVKELEMTEEVLEGFWQVCPVHMQARVPAGESCITGMSGWSLSVWWYWWLSALDERNALSHPCLEIIIRAWQWFVKHHCCIFYHVWLSSLRDHLGMDHRPWWVKLITVSNIKCLSKKKSFIFYQTSIMDHHWWTLWWMLNNEEWSACQLFTLININQVIKDLP